MPSTKELIEAYGNIPIPDIDEMTFKEAYERGIDVYFIRQSLLRLYERDTITIKEDRGS